IHQSLPPHPNIVTLHRTLETPSFLLLLLEYNPSSSPSSSNLSRTPPTPSLLATMDPSQLLTRTRLRLIASMFRQMCEAVEFCHSQQVFHRDIKPENFIVTEETLPSSSTYSLRSSRKVVVKLTDFGLSTTDEESGDMDCGSAPYMSYGRYSILISTSQQDG
ncbi:kinase-like protein, partial [Fistulina hepatica ATCC 64428]